METVHFILDREHIALNDLLKLTGLASSGGLAKRMIAEGEVTVDGQVETRKTCKIRHDQDVRLGDTGIVHVRRGDSAATVAPVAVDLAQPGERAN